MKGRKPNKEMNGLIFLPIPNVNDVDIAFGLDESSYFDRSNLPDVPEKYESMASNLMFNGGSLPKISKEVDNKKAIRAVKAWLHSFAPAHESKIRTVAYALWVWSEAES